MKKSLLALSVASAALMSGQANAFIIDTGNDSDWDIRWDTTVKYNLSSRTESPDGEVTDFPITTAPNVSVSRNNGGIVSNRLDLLTEADFIWKENYGFRISAAGWYDHAYKDNDHKDYLGHEAFAPSFWSNNYSVDIGEYNGEVDRYHHKGGELLDAFVFANFDINDEVSMGIRAGRHTLYWGQSLLTAGAVHGVASAMSAIDGLKALSVPGSEAKELFMPSNKISTSIQMGSNVTLSAFYSLEFVPMRTPQDGSFYSPVDGFSGEGELLPIGPALAAQGGAEGNAAFGFYYGNNGGSGYRIIDAEDGDNGDWGVNLGYYSEGMDADFSFFYVNYQDKLPQGHVGAWYGGAVPPTLLERADGSMYEINGEVKLVYKDSIEVFGMSVMKEIWDISWGLEINHRSNAPIYQDMFAVLQGLAPTSFDGTPLEFVPGQNTGLDLGQGTPAGAGFVDVSTCNESNYCSAVGDINSVIINAVGLLDDALLWEGGAWIVEYVASQVTELNVNGYRMLKKEVSEYNVSHNVSFRFKPKWYQVLPGVDLEGKVALSYQIDEYSAMVFGGVEQQGAAVLGLEARVDETYTVGMNYTNLFGPVADGLGGRLKDKDTVSLTVKRTF